MTLAELYRNLVKFNFELHSIKIWLSKQLNELTKLYNLKHIETVNHTVVSIFKLFRRLFLFSSFGRIGQGSKQIYLLSSRIEKHLSQRISGTNLSPLITDVSPICVSEAYHVKRLLGWNLSGFKKIIYIWVPPPTVMRHPEEYCINYTTLSI